MLEDFNDWLQDFKAGKREAVNVLYDEFRSSFVHWILKKHNCSEEDAVDIFQDAIIALYKNAKAGKLENLTSQLKTYLFAIGKNIFLSQLRQRKETTSDAPLEFTESSEIRAQDMLQSMDRKKMIARLLKQMQHPCQRILYLFFYRQYSIEAIQKDLNYKSQDVVKTQKRRCIKALQAQMAKEFKRDDI
ncbi:MAG: sigma-70 family RNA polymerase sigma factor [Chitinophagales bacterium]